MATLLLRVRRITVADRRFTMRSFEEKSMNKQQHTVAALIIAGCWTSIAVADITVRFETPNVTVGLGQSFDLNILADIPDTEPVIGWGLDLIIDNDLIASRDPGQTIGSDWISAAALDGDGLAGLAPFGFPPVSITGDSVLLATVTLTATGIGQTDLLLATTIGDLSEGFALDFAGFAAVNFEAGQFTVIPEPATNTLAVLGFVLACLQRR